MTEQEAVKLIMEAMGWTLCTNGETVDDLLFYNDGKYQAGRYALTECLDLNVLSNEIWSIKKWQIHLDYSDDGVQIIDFVGYIQADWQHGATIQDAAMIATAQALKEVKGE